MMKKKMDSDDTVVQLTEYVHPLLNKESDGKRVSVDYEFVYRLLFEEKRKNFRLVKFNKLRPSTRFFTELSTPSVFDSFRY